MVTFGCMGGGKDAFVPRGGGALSGADAGPDILRVAFVGIGTVPFKLGAAAGTVPLAVALTGKGTTTAEPLPLGPAAGAKPVALIGAGAEEFVMITAPPGANAAIGPGAGTGAVRLAGKLPFAAVPFRTVAVGTVPLSPVALGNDPFGAVALADGAVAVVLFASVPFTREGAGAATGAGAGALEGAAPGLGTAGEGENAEHYGVMLTRSHNCNKTK